MSSGNLTLTDGTVSSNSTAGANATGGGIRVGNGSIGYLTLTNSTVSGNSTAGVNAIGGGIFATVGNVTLANSTVSSNSTAGARADGGGILTDLADVTLTNSTISSNSATGVGSEAGGIQTNDGVLTIMNSIVSGNTDDGTAPDFLAPDSVDDLTVGFSLIGDNTGTTLTEAQTADGNGNLIGSSSTPIDPLLGPLAFNGGLTRTHALLPGSPAIDAGSNALAVDEDCLLYTSPSPRDATLSRMPSSA